MKEFFNSFIGGVILIAAFIGMGTLYCYVLVDFVRFLVKTSHPAWMIAPILVLFFSFGAGWLDGRLLLFVFAQVVILVAPLTLRLANRKANSKSYNASLVLCSVVGFITLIAWGYRLITTGK